MPNSWTSPVDGKNWSRTSDHSDSPWYDAGTQSARSAIPADGDSITISSGKQVFMNVDMTGWAGLAALVVTGTLTYLAGGNRKLVMAANITGAGMVNIGAAGTGNEWSSTYTANILLNGNFSINGPTCNFYCNPAGGRVGSTENEATGWMTLIPPPNTASTTPYDGSIPASMPITSISQGATCTVVCSAAHGFTAGANVVLRKLGTMTQLEGVRVRVLAASTTRVTGDTATLKWFDFSVKIDSTSFGAYSGGAGVLCSATAAAAGATTLYVDGNMSADAEWTRAGALLNIDNCNRAAQSERRTINTVSNGSLTITAGLTAAKNTGSPVILVTRNVMVTGTASTVNLFLSGTAGPHVLNAAFLHIGSAGSAVSLQTASEAVTFARGCISSNGTSTLFGITCAATPTVTMSGGVMSGFTAAVGTLAAAGGGINSGVNHVISGGLISGCTNGINAATNVQISGTVEFNGLLTALNAIIGGLVSGGLFSGCGTKLMSTVGIMVTGTTAINCNTLNNASFGTTVTGGTSLGFLTGRLNCRGSVVSGGLMLGVSVPISGSDVTVQGLAIPTGSVLSGGQVKGLGATFTGWTSYGQTNNGLGGWQQAISYDNAGIIGNVAAWMSGGTIAPDTATIPAGSSPTLSTANKFDFAAPAFTAGVGAYPGSTLTNAYPCFYDLPIFARAGQAISASIQVNSTVAYGSMYEAPRIQIIDPNVGPPLAAGQLLVETASTAGANAWATLSVSYTATADRPLIVRIRGCHASGSCWVSVPIIQIGGGLLVPPTMDGGFQRE